MHSDAMPIAGRESNFRATIRARSAIVLHIQQQRAPAGLPLDDVVGVVDRYGLTHSRQNGAALSCRSEADRALRRSRIVNATVQNTHDRGSDASCKVR